MSYTRFLEDGCYIYPEETGIRIMYFPNQELSFIPNSILDVILYKMSNEELQDRRKNGRLILTKMQFDISNGCDEFTKERGGKKNA